MMKINKSKRQLAQLLIEVGVTKFPDGANWAAQDKSGKEIYCYKNKPRRPLSWSSWHHGGVVVSNGEFQANALIANWHQTVLSSDEFDQIVAEIVADAVRDADGWIEWSGGECPVDVDALVCCKLRSGKVSITAYHAGMLSWRHSGNAADIIAYRLHEPEQSKPEFCESVIRSIPEPEAKPTIEQLAADYRSKLDYANRKQDEADKANMESDAALSQLEDAIAAIGFVITPLAATEKEPELVITDWRDLQVDDVIELTGSVNPCWKEHAGIEMTVKEVHHDQGAGDDQVDLLGESGCWSLGGNTTWRFIRRP